MKKSIQSKMEMRKESRSMQLIEKFRNILEKDKNVFFSLTISYYQDI